MVVAAVLGPFIWAWLEAPNFVAPKGLKHQEWLAAVRDRQLEFIQAGAATFVACGLLFTARNYRLAHRGQLTERLSKALEHLDSDETYIRIGGIHALLHLMEEAAELHQDVVQLLVAFIRDKTREPFDPYFKLRLESDSDVQAALDALGKRPRRPEYQRLNLSNLHLQGAVLAGAKLRYARLENTDLREAVLDFSDLRWAKLAGTKLEGAQPHSTKLQDTEGLLAAQLNAAHLNSSTELPPPFLHNESAQKVTTG
ncbi:pentapeptide repeat-containing protein [Streptomyces sp. NPDC026206]|uniref:pentapeptide repeat-containing protein n=1 Tax=Streptomyces sp. NPDC026206 TaxID=3157089 RepID=UPI0033C00A50